MKTSSILALLPLVLLPGCDHLGALPFQHEVDLELRLDPNPSFVLANTVGDVEVIGTDGPSRLHATLHETLEKDAELVMSDGALVVRTASGERAYIGRVRLELPRSIRRLEVDAPVGDVRIVGFQRIEELEVDSGTGDASVVDLAGNRELRISNGVGDVNLRDVVSDRVEVDSGVGDARFADCRIGHLSADLGVGDVLAGSSVAATQSLDTGVGDVVPPETVSSGR